MYAGALAQGRHLFVRDSPHHHRPRCSCLTPRHSSEVRFVAGKELLPRRQTTASVSPCSGADRTQATFCQEARESPDDGNKKLKVSKRVVTNSRGGLTFDSSSVMFHYVLCFV